MNNKRFWGALLAVSAAVLSLTSCFKQEYVERTYTAMYRADSISRWGSRFIAYYTHDPAVEQEIREFYRSLDTSLIYKGYLLLYYGERQYETWCAIDWQITEMDVVCLKDWDEEHPAGSSIKEKCFIEYNYMHRPHSKPLTDIKYGELMLCDIYPLVDNREHFTIHFKEPADETKYHRHRAEFPDDPMLELHVKDAFGRHFKVPF